MKYDLAIVGAGPAGLSASVYASVITSYSIHYTKLYEEFFRLAQKNSQIVVTVWNLWSISNCFGRKKYLKNIWQNWKNKILGKSELDWNDCQISFTDNQGRVFWRYHHAFTRREMQRLFRITSYNVCYTKLLRLASLARLVVQ